MFNVLNLASGKLVMQADGTTPLVFDTGDLASAHCAMLLLATGIKHQPRRAVVDNEVWRARERARFSSGQYTRLPWDAYWDENSSEHRYQRRYAWFYNVKGGAFAHAYPHASKEHPGKIAYTPDDASGQADRQTVCSPGRFLTTFYSHILSSNAIRDAATQYSAQFGEHEMKFARTEDEVISVYTNGPSSCMSHSVRDYSGHVHPTAVYGDNPDLAVAYLVVKGVSDDDDAPANERITARVVCWPEHKVYSTIYGDRTRLEMHLRTAGYRYGNLCGARLRKIRNERGSGWIMPYLDNYQYIEDDGDYFVISNDSTGMCANNTHGLISEGEYCPHCEEYRDARNFNHVADVDEQWCHACCRDDTFWCDQTDRRYSNDVAVRMHNGELWSQEAFDDYGAVCDYDGENYHADHMVAVTNNDGDEVQWYRRNFARHGMHCPHCELDVPRDHVCDEAPTEAHTVSERDTDTSPLFAEQLPLSDARRFSVGDRVRFTANSTGHAATCEATATVVGYHTSDYWPGRELVMLCWDDTPARNGQRDGDYWPADLELEPMPAAVDVWALETGDMVVITPHAWGCDIRGGTFPIVEFDNDAASYPPGPYQRSRYVRVNMDHDFGGRHHLWIDPRNITHVIRNQQTIPFAQAA